MSWSTRRLGSLLVLVALVLAGLGAMAPRADAHANLVRSDPGSDAVLPNAPRQVQLWFSEDPDSAFTEIRVLDSAGQRVDQGGTKAVPGDRLAVVTAVHELAPGSYTVAWKALSAVDGHVTRGAFAFTVGLDQASAGIVLPADEGYSATFPLSVLVRWLNYLGLAGLGAFFLFVPFVLLPALRATPAVAISESDSVGQARRLALASWVVAIVATLLLAVYQANEASGAGLFAAGPLVTLLTGTRFGTLWWTRLALLLVLGALVWQWPRLRTVRENWPHALGFALLASVLATQALGSHSAGAPTATWVAIALDWLHLVGVVAWIGGIVHLLVQLPILARAGSRADSAKVLAATVSRFSRLATISVAVLAATGIYQTWLLVGSLDALLGTDYGWTLLLKLALVAPLVALGGVNQFGWAPRLTRLATTAAKTAAAAGAGLERRFTFTVGAEVGLAVLLLGVVGGLTSIEPARDAILSQGIRRTVTAADLRADVRVQPGIAGLNVFQVRVTENGRPAANVERVTLRFNFVEEDLGESELVLRSRGDGVFSGQGSNVLRVGAWKVDLQIRRQGRDDALASLEVRARDQNIVATAPGTVTPAGGLVATEGGFILGVELALFGLVLGLGAQRLGGKRRRYRVLGVQLAAVLILGGGSYLATTSYATAIYPKTLTNPFPPTQASLQKGGEIYTNNCVSCHGLSGRGDGPLARTLTPRPADLRVHVSQHADGQLYTWIANGVPGTAMPPFKDRLSDEERWHVLNYLKSLTRPQS